MVQESARLKNTKRLHHSRAVQVHVGLVAEEQTHVEPADPRIGRSCRVMFRASFATATPPSAMFTAICHHRGVALRVRPGREGRAEGAGEVEVRGGKGVSARPEPPGASRAGETQRGGEQGPEDLRMGVAVQQRWTHCPLWL